MVEEEHLEQSTNSITMKQQETNEEVHNCRKQKITIVLVVLGLYFLLLMVIEFVTNYRQTRYEYAFACTEKQCTSHTDFITFPDAGTIYLYLKNSRTSQNDISFQSLPNTALTSFQTNLQMSKSLSLTGSTLSDRKSAYPQGQFLSYFPEGTFTCTKVTSSQQVTISSEDLSMWSSELTNLADKSQQWADVESGRFAVWEEKHVAGTFKKFWGKISTVLSGQYEIDLNANNLIQTAFKSSLSVELTDGKAFGGYNFPLLIISGLFAIILFFLSCLSFLFNLSSNGLDNQSQQQLTSDAFPINIHQPSPIPTFVQNT